uniref:Uncharacterized protein n=1 Tax=viral metagenome TaxID=1070528 RepID=A0A6C0AP37_9ZZZZ
MEHWLVYKVMSFPDMWDVEKLVGIFHSMIKANTFAKEQDRTIHSYRIHHITVNTDGLVQTDRVVWSN